MLSAILIKSFPNTHRLACNANLCVCACVCVSHSVVSNSLQSQTVAHQAPPSMGILQVRIMERVAIPMRINTKKELPV